MDDNKLYNALLKSQEEQKRKDGDLERLTDQRRDPGPDQKSRSDRYRTSWRNFTTHDDDRIPTVYDASVSLGLIANPRPWSREQLRKRKIIYPGMSDKAVMDAYREIRILLRNRARTLGFTVMVSSLGLERNSLLTSFNLAVAFAMDSHTSALLVDCDPYNRELQDLVSSDLDAGVTDFVADPSLSVKKILYPSGVDRLTVIPAGYQVSSAVELFASVRMRELMTELRERYPDRCIVVNAPPFRASTEARILERFCDQVVFSVPFGEVSGDDVAEAVEALGSDKFTGLVFQE